MTGLHMAEGLIGPPIRKMAAKKTSKGSAGESRSKKAKIIIPCHIGSHIIIHYMY